MVVKNKFKILKICGKNGFAYGWYLRMAGQHLARDELSAWRDYRSHHSFHRIDVRFSVHTYFIGPLLYVLQVLEAIKVL